MMPIDDPAIGLIVMVMVLAICAAAWAAGLIGDDKQK